MTNQEKFIEVFGVGTWRKLIRCSSVITKEFKEFWTSKYDKQKGAR